MTTQQSSQQGPSEPIDVGLSQIFNYEELQEATKFFNPSEVVGEGGFGVVYRGKLRDGRFVAIKELTVRHKKRIEQFFNEVRLLSGLRHKNLATLYGCTSPDDEKMLLVYEFAPNGTVADHLHHRRFSKKALTWSQRLQIAIQTAEALAYLHSLHPPIIHRDVKTDNILLDDNYNVKVADFGLCRLLPLSGAHVSTMPQGTQGYLDPEYNQLYKLTTKSDVYSFGVVLLELISGKAVLDYEEPDDDEIWLVRKAFNKMKHDDLHQLLDLYIGYLDDREIFRMVNSVAKLAYECLMPTGDRRPSVMEVLRSLNVISHDPTSASSAIATKTTSVMPPPPAKIMTSMHPPRKQQLLYSSPTEIKTSIQPATATKLQSMPVLEAELTAIRTALYLLQQHRHVKECKSLLTAIPDVCVSKIARQANLVAHQLAQYAKQSDNYLYIMYNPPDFIVSVLQQDSM